MQQQYDINRPATRKVAAASLFGAALLLALIITPAVPAVASAQGSFAVATDKPAYMAGEKVTVAGNVGKAPAGGQQQQQQGGREEGEEAAAAAAVSIQIFNSENKVFASGQAPVSAADGSFRYSFSLQGPLAVPGPFGVVATYGDTFAQAQFTLEQKKNGDSATAAAANNNNNATALTVAADRKSYTAGDVVTITGTAAAKKGGSSGNAAAMVTITVTGPGGRQVLSESARIAEDGSFRYLLGTGALAGPGTYKVTVRQDGGDNDDDNNIQSAAAAQTQFSYSLPGRGLKVIAVGKATSPLVTVRVTNTSDHDLYGIYLRLSPEGNVTKVWAPRGWSGEVHGGDAGFTAGAAPLKPGKTLGLRVWASPAAQSIDWSAYGLDGSSLEGRANVGLRGVRS